MEMAQQIERQSNSSGKDYLPDTRQRLPVEPFWFSTLSPHLYDHDDPLGGECHWRDQPRSPISEIGPHLKIPAAYYDRMLSDYPELLAENVKFPGFQGNRKPAVWSRTLDGCTGVF